MKKSRSPKKTNVSPLVVIVDDDESVRNSIQNLTRSMGFRTEAFESAEAFLNSHLVDQAGCLLLDVRMPGMNGLQLMERLNEMGSTIPVIFVTAHYTEDLRKQALNGRAIEFLSKPFSEKALLDAISAALKKE